MKEKANRLVEGVKSVSDFLSDAIDAFKGSSFTGAIEKALPWAGTIGEATAEALPPLKFFTKIAEDLLKETDPEKLGFTACTLAYQKAVENAFQKIGSPAGERQSVKEAKEQLREIGHWEEVDMGTFSLDAPQQHEFYEQAKLCLQVAAIKVGYTQPQVDEITMLVQDDFRLSLTKILTDGETRENFAPFTEYLNLGGADEKRSRKMLAQHANYQRWLFEQSPVLRVSPFALNHVYIDTDCGKSTWEEINTQQRSSENRFNPFSEQHGGRQPLLNTVLDLIEDKNLSEAIIIQGVAGAGKSSFTLKLCDELLRRRLHPIRVRIKDLSFDKHIKDSLPQAVTFTDEDYPEAEPPAFDNLFLDESIFKEKGVGRYEHICKYVIILDGWDEISLSEEGFKTKVARMLDQINDHYLKQRSPRIRVILTGRPSSDIGDTKALREKTPFLTIRKLRPEQLEKYVASLAEAVNSETPLIEKNDQSESWTVPPLSRFKPIFDKYRKAFEQTRQAPESGELDVLGLPLLSYLTVRLVAEWKGDLTPLIENTTTLYRHLVDLTCKEAAKIEDSEDSGNQYKIYGEELRQLLRQTAHTITMSGGENISLKELAQRLDIDDEQLDTQASRLEKANKLSSLMISFYFKGGHAHLGCEFAHKSFREYLFAESIVETLKDYGRKQKRTPPARENYWEDFSENKPNDFRFELSRNLSKLLAPQWLTDEVTNHLHQLLQWEIERAVNRGKEKRPGTPTEPVTWDEWKQIRTALADLWEWWGEGAHLRPQPFKEEGVAKLRPAYVNKLIEWDAPRDARISTWGYARTTTMDAHLGEGLFTLCTRVHAFMAEFENDTDTNRITERKYQSIDGQNGKNLVLFKPSGDNPGYFKNYIARINSAGLRLHFSFPCQAFMHRVDLRRVYLDNTDLYGADFKGANLSGASLAETDLRTINFNNAILREANLYLAALIKASFVDANLTGADLSSTDFTNASLANANLTDAIFHSATIDNANFDDISSLLLATYIDSATFGYIYLNEKPLSRDEVLEMLIENSEERQKNP